MVSQTFAQRVRSRRERLGLTLEDVAKRLGVTKGAVSHYEMERAYPDYPKLDKLAAILEVDRDWLIYGGDERYADRLMPLAGVIDAGGVVRPPGKAEPLVLKPAELRNLVDRLTAYRVESETVTRPCYCRNDILYCLPSPFVSAGNAEPPPLYGLPAVVRFGSRTMFTTNLQPGQRPGTVTLVSGEREVVRDAKPEHVELIVMVIHNRLKVLLNAKG